MHKPAVVPTQTSSQGRKQAEVEQANLQVREQIKLNAGLTSKQPESTTSCINLLTNQVAYKAADKNHARQREQQRLSVGSVQVKQGLDKHVAGLAPAEGQKRGGSHEEHPRDRLKQLLMDGQSGRQTTANQRVVSQRVSSATTETRGRSIHSKQEHIKAGHK